MKNPTLAMIPSGYKGNTATLPSVYSVLPSDGSGDFTFDRANGLATRINKEGLLEEVANDTPRLDYSNGTCPVLLLEKEKTNLVSFSESPSSGAWNKFTDSTTAVVITANQIISPSGELNADKIVYGNGTSLVTKNTTVVSGQLYNISVYLKGENGGEQIQLDFRNSASQGVSGTQFTLTNKWKRYNVSLTSNQTNLGIQFRVYTTGQIFYAWGAQIELGHLTSYIPSTGAGTVTRFDDVCGNAGDASLFNSYEGTLFVDIQKSFKDSNSGSISISDGSNNNRVVIAKQSNNTQFRMFIARVSSGNIIAQLTLNIDFNDQNKLAITFKFGEFKFYVNGVLSSTQTPNEDIPIGLSKFAFNENNLGSQDFFGEINDVRYYNTVLTEAEAIKLTT